MPYIAAVTQSSWIKVLQTNGYGQEVNFWRPGRQGISKNLIGSFIIFVRKGKSPRKVMGFAKIKGFERLTIREAWLRWNVKNGVSSLAEFVNAITKVAEKTSTNGGGLRNVIDGEDSLIGCTILSDVVLLSEESAPVSDLVLPDLPKNVVSYKKYPDSFPPLMQGLLEQSTSSMGPSPSDVSLNYVIHSRSEGRFSITRSVWERNASSGSPFFLQVVDQSGGRPERIFRLPSQLVTEEVIKKIGWQDGSRIYIQVSITSDRILFVSNRNAARRTPLTSEHSVHLDGVPFRIAIEDTSKISSVEKTGNRYPEPGEPGHTLAESPAPQYAISTKSRQTRFYRAQHLEFENLTREAKEIGAAGEQLILDIEKGALVAAGRDDLARLVEHTSIVKGDGAGYDIRSYSPDGQPKFIEVKTTTSGVRTAFLITANELAFAKDHIDQYWVYRVYDFLRGSRYFKLSGSGLLGLRFEPMQFRVSFSGVRQSHRKTSTP